jgi:hypothetical protein
MSAEQSVFGTPRPALTDEQKLQMLREVQAQLLTMAHIMTTHELVDGEWKRIGDVNAMMELATEAATHSVLGEAEGFRAFVYAQKLIVDGGDTAVAYQLKKWGCREFPPQAKRDIISGGLLLAMASGTLAKAYLDALANIARWIRMPDDDFRAVLQSASAQLRDPAARS